jgi:hypothetical protein
LRNERRWHVAAFITTKTCITLDRVSECCVELRIVSRYEDCRKLASECMEWAERADTDDDRQMFLKLAQCWLTAAVIMRPSDAPYQGTKLH